MESVTLQQNHPLTMTYNWSVQSVYTYFQDVAMNVVGNLIEHMQKAGIGRPVRLACPSPCKFRIILYNVCLILVLNGSSNRAPNSPSRWPASSPRLSFPLHGTSSVIHTHFPFTALLRFWFYDHKKQRKFSSSSSRPSICSLTRPLPDLSCLKSQVSLLEPIPSQQPLHSTLVSLRTHSRCSFLLLLIGESAEPCSDMHP